MGCPQLSAARSGGYRAHVSGGALITRCVGSGRDTHVFVKSVEEKSGGGQKASLRAPLDFVQYSFDFLLDLASIDTEMVPNKF